ncbi:hypothetical protein FF1_018738 [Malus domestica]
MAGERYEAESSMDASALPNVEINPNQRLSSILLNEFNYLPWSRAVSLALGREIKAWLRKWCHKSSSSHFSYLRVVAMYRPVGHVLVAQLNGA